MIGKYLPLAPLQLLFLSLRLPSGGCLPPSTLPPWSRVIIAIVDDGVDGLRPSLGAHLAVNAAEIPGNGIDDDQNGLIDDTHGYDFLQHDPDPAPDARGPDPSHGTMMALIAMDAADNAFREPTRGQVVVLPLRVADQNTVDVAAVVNAIDYAAGRGERTVVNLSMGTARGRLPVRVTDTLARRAEILFILAAGNQGKPISEMRASLCRDHPPNVICVAAVDGDDRLAGYPRASNFGPSVDIAAPGVNILVTTSNGVKMRESGTSLAAAHVSGLAARIWSARPALSPPELARALCAGARPAPAVPIRCGVVDVERSTRRPVW